LLGNQGPRRFKRLDTLLGLLELSLGPPHLPGLLPDDPLLIGQVRDPYSYECWQHATAS
jgi:hypothetical protein